MRTLDEDGATLPHIAARMRELEIRPVVRSAGPYWEPMVDVGITECQRAATDGAAVMLVDEQKHPLAFRISAPARPLDRHASHDTDHRQRFIQERE